MVGFPFSHKQPLAVFRLPGGSVSRRSDLPSRPISWPGRPGRLQLSLRLPHRFVGWRRAATEHGLFLPLSPLPPLAQPARPHPATRRTMVRPVNRVARSCRASAAWENPATSGTIYPLLAAMPKALGSKGNEGNRGKADVLFEILGHELGTARCIHAIQHEFSFTFRIAAWRQDLKQGPAFAQAGQIWRGGQDDIVGGGKDVLAPFGLQMRHIDHHQGRPCGRSVPEGGPRFPRRDGELREDLYV